MAWKIDSSATFTGGSGQMAVMGELLARRCNAAVPHVDVGMDVFAFRDDREEVARIQVKTASGKRRSGGKGYDARFRIPLKQLERTDDPRLFYALAVRLDNEWGDFIVIGRGELQQLRSDGCGAEYTTDLGLDIQFRFDLSGKSQGNEADSEPSWHAKCGEFDLTSYINAWESLPPLRPVAPIDKDP